ncbi:DUF3500 domain-containing protein [Demequina lignilytica]|uniref:DUF3500 domain-containing protein n=1 Tax=Demequina lignilytica TaxID=3051663 RepID=A0AB35MG98_9MICO|nr:DUF3500 domain-containing protein [Demequina sp. SYSU T0a273]MDN4482819.1 DUF3500 domain-containing protein [Demequina sp. SYSU T0a273]
MITIRPAVRRALALGVAVGLATTLAACSATDDSSTTESTTSTASTASTAVTAASEDSNTAEVVAAAEAFLATLDEDQLALVQLSYDDLEDKANWSNLPNGQVDRPGLARGDMTDEQLAALDVLLQAMLSDEGYEEVVEVMTADDVLAGNVETTYRYGESDSDALNSSTSGAAAAGGPGDGGTPPDMGDGTAPTDVPTDGAMPTGDVATAPGDMGGGLEYGSDIYFIAFYGDVSADSAFEIQFGGHHLALMAAYSGDTVTIAPYFAGIEPQSWTTTDGESSEPLGEKKAAAQTLMASLTDDQAAAAELSMVYNAVVMGPGEDSGDYPDDEGILVSDLTEEQQELVTALITEYVGVLDEDEAQEIIDTYVSQYGETYLSWSGALDTDDGSTYLRLSGPQVWIEFDMENGIVYDALHIHSVYRDKLYDYGDASQYAS